MNSFKRFQDGWIPDDFGIVLIEEITERYSGLCELLYTYPSVDRVSAHLRRFPCELNKQDKNGDTPLMLAIKARNWNVVNLLLQMNADVNIVNDNGDTTLDFAVTYGNYDLTKRISELTKIENKNTKTLIKAIESRKVENVRATLETNFSVNGVTASWDVPLLKAIEIKNSEMVQLLLEKGAYPHISDYYGYNTIMKAILSENRYIFDLIMQYGPDLTLRTSDGNTVFSLAVEKGVYYWFENYYDYFNEKEKELYKTLKSGVAINVIY